MTIHRRLEERLAEFKRRERALLFGSGYLANMGVIAALARAGRRRLLRRAQPRLDHRRLPAVARRDLRLRPLRRRAPAPGASRAGRGPRRADRHRQRLLDGRRRRAARGDRRAAPSATAPRRRRRGPRHRRARPRRPRRGRRGGPRGRGRRDRRHARQGARLLRRVRRLRRDDGPLPRQRAPARSSSRRRLPPPAVAGALAALDLLEERPRARREARRATPRRCATSWRARASTSGDSRTQIVPLVIGDADARGASLRGGARARRVRAGDPPADRARGHLAAAAGGDGHAPRGRSCATPRGRSRQAAARGASVRAAVRRVRRPSGRRRVPVRSRRSPSRRARAARRGRRVARRRRCAAPAGHGATSKRRAALADRRRSGRAVRGCFVTGTDTGVGKTVVAAAIVAALRARRQSRSARSSRLITGLDEPPDPTGRPTTSCWRGRPARAPTRSRATGFGPAVSPHLAAELAGSAPIDRRADAGDPRPRRGGRVADAGRRGRRRAARAAQPGRTTSATWPPTLDCRWSSPRAPGSARSTTRC